MKRLFSIAILLLIIVCSTQIYAQNDFSAYSLSNWQREGTARGIGIGNALTALGGDIGAININPASSGVYKFSEVSFTPSFNFVTTTSDLFGQTYKSKRNTFGISNAGGVFNFDTGYRIGLVGWSFGVVYTKLNNYNTRERAINRQNTNDPTFVEYLADFTQNNLDPAKATDMDINEQLGLNPYKNFGPGMWPSILAWNTSLINVNSAGTAFVPTEQLGLKQSFHRKTFGHNDATDLNVGLNFNNKLYVGANITLTTIWSRICEGYSEDATESGDFNYMDYYYEQKTTGSGIGGKVGIIYTPTKNIRLGAAVSTPTVYYLTDRAYWAMNSSLGTNYTAELSTPDVEMDYRITTPFSYNVGFAFTHPYGTLSFDYEGTDLSQMRIKDQNNFEDFSDINDIIKKSYTRVDKVRIGAEINPVHNVSLRAGFQYSNSGIKDINIENFIGSLGIGYSNQNGFFADLGFSRTLKSTDVVLDGSDLATAFVTSNATKAYERNNWKLLFTIGLRF